MNYSSKDNLNWQEVACGIILVLLANTLFRSLFFTPSTSERKLACYNKCKSANNSDDICRDICSIYSLKK